MLHQLSNYFKSKCGILPNCALIPFGLRRSERYEWRDSEKKFTEKEIVEKELGIPVIAMVRAEDLLEGWKTHEELTDSMMEELKDDAKRKGIMLSDTQKVVTNEV